MRVVAFMVVIVVAACGRGRFDPFETGTDAPLGGDALDVAPDAPPTPCAAATTAPDPLRISGVTEHVTNFAGDFTVVSGVAVTITDSAVGSTLATTTSAADGTYAVSVPTGGVPRAIYATFTNVSYLTAMYFPPRALAADFVLDPNMSNTGSLDTVYGAAGQTYDASRGTLIVLATDCGGAPLAGVSFDIEPQPVALSYAGSATDPFPPGETATTQPLAQAAAFGEPAGVPAIIPTGDGLTFAGTTVLMDANAVTYVTFEPTP